MTIVIDTPVNQTRSRGYGADAHPTPDTTTQLASNE
jgi:hypothetical protein